jgi:hypothetical protein
MQNLETDNIHILLHELGHTFALDGKSQRLHLHVDNHEC